jgi:hypothetical protein
MPRFRLLPRVKQQVPPLRIAIDKANRNTSVGGDRLFFTLHCLILGLATEYSKSVRKFTAM